MRKIISICLIFILIISCLCACSKEVKKTDNESKTNTKIIQNEDKASEKDKEKEPETVNLSVMTAKFNQDSLGTPVHNEWIKKINEYTGKKINWDWQFVPFGEISNKSKLMFASGELPDIMLGFKKEIFEYGPQEIILDLEKYKSNIPNYIRMLDKDKNSKNNVYTPQGNLYAFFDASILDFDTTQNLWLYRFDIFKKHNIPIPSTIEEFYEAAKKLKGIYPDVYPIGSDANLSWLVTTWSLVNRVGYDVYWNFENDRYEYGPCKEGFKDAIAFLAKLYNEKLLDPEFSINTKEQVIQKNVTDKTFMIANSYGGRAWSYNDTEGFNGEWGISLEVKNEKYGEPINQGIRRKGMSFSTWSGIVISAKTKYPELACKIIDHQYSDEIIELMNWGIEDVTFKKNSEGKREFLPEFMNSDNPRVGLADNGVSSTMWCRSGIPFTPQHHAAQVALESREISFCQNSKYQKLSNYWINHDKINFFVPPEAPTFNFTADENEFISNQMTPIKTFVEESILKFITDDKPMSEWNDFVSQISKYGDLQGVLDLYNKKVK